VNLFVIVLNGLATLSLYFFILKSIQRHFVETNKGYLFLSVSLGKISVDCKTIMAISPQSPIGERLMGLKANDCVEANTINYVIEKIF